MKYVDEDYLLTNETARLLYHRYAKELPIIDYHCHLNPREIYENKKFHNLTELWLDADHYKWRLMRANGIEEAYITGKASDYDKFVCWARTLEKAIANPLYQWCHMELKKYFHYDGILSEETASKVWNLSLDAFGEDGIGAQDFIRQSNVEILCTTDDPIHSLEYHKKLKGFSTQVLPTFRPDIALHIEHMDYVYYIRELGKCCGMEIQHYKQLKEALIMRMDYFCEHGCVISDHSLSYVPFVFGEEMAVENVFKKKMRGFAISELDVVQFQTQLLLDLAKEYYKRDWTMQLHYGVMRNVNQSLFRKKGPDIGVDAISNDSSAAYLGQFMDFLEREDHLPKMILYSLNPEDASMLETIISCFNKDDCVGKIQQGSAWWFNDHKYGIEQALEIKANMGLLGNFIGMLTDSRSFVSYARHEYFRRILCNKIGQWVEDGACPRDEKNLGQIVKAISYTNAREYFGWPDL